MSLPPTAEPGAGASPWRPALARVASLAVGLAGWSDRCGSRRDPDLFVTYRAARSRRAAAAPRWTSSPSPSRGQAVDGLQWPRVSHVPRGGPSRRWSLVLLRGLVAALVLGVLSHDALPSRSPVPFAVVRDSAASASSFFSLPHHAFTFLGVAASRALWAWETGPPCLARAALMALRQPPRGLRAGGRAAGHGRRRARLALWDVCGPGAARAERPWSRSCPDGAHRNPAPTPSEPRGEHRGLGDQPFGFHNWIAVFHTMGNPFSPHLSEWTPPSEQVLSVRLPVYPLMGTLAAVMLAAWRSARSRSGRRSARGAPFATRASRRSSRPAPRRSPPVSPRVALRRLPARARARGCGRPMRVLGSPSSSARSSPCARGAPTRDPQVRSGRPSPGSSSRRRTATGADPQ
jgi:hypothetical protein